MGFVQHFTWLKREMSMVHPNAEAFFEAMLGQYSVNFG